MDKRYENGKIYTIRCRYDDNLIYVGSTIEKYLSCRLAKHRHTTKGSLYQYVKGDWNNWYIELYEDYPCNNKQQLLKREGEIIRQIATINKLIAGRNKKQHYQDNRDEILEKSKQYRQDNRDKLLEQKKQYYQENRDNISEYHKQYYQDNRDKFLEKEKQYRQDNPEKMKKYYQDNRDKLLENKKQYYQDNRDNILEQQNQKITCEICGFIGTKHHLKRHQKTKKCMDAKK